MLFTEDGECVWSLWVQCFCTALVALGAAYASYRHGREFALHSGADGATASIWPLIVDGLLTTAVDGLLTTATVELWKPSPGRHLGGRCTAWVAFGFGISLSLCANIGSAPTLTVFSVAACPPPALLLAVELLNRALKRYRQSLEGNPSRREEEADETGSDPESNTCPRQVAEDFELGAELSAEERMWAYYQAERAKGQTSTGANLDRIAGTNNYGDAFFDAGALTAATQLGARPEVIPRQRSLRYLSRQAERSLASLTRWLRVGCLICRIMSNDAGQNLFLCSAAVSVVR
ncbi:DUF2637 domain-containing protein [Amycolatopsis sp. PS_44_ISF1]|uniref:DUF2637 domain-containing protein n=1 Tax=Amycolatopsis sp. PS_44_ISF1 TaxID=2974917 RepID=UPI0028E5B881|nr:DUF2637 domain-containing protein [Amycolatopsis sp. PS_44_ISF1]